MSGITRSAVGITLLALGVAMGCSDDSSSSVSYVGADTGSGGEKDTSGQAPDTSDDTAGPGQDAGAGQDTIASEDTGGAEDVEPRVGEDAGKMPCEKPAELGCACQAAADCESGACWYGEAGKVCTPATDCPEGFHSVTTSAVSASGAACEWDLARLCQPCGADADCGGAQAACLDYGDAGRYCGIACAVAGDCPQGYDCASGQCRAASGQCQCNDFGSTQLSETSCAVSNAQGRCEGSRLCTDQGLTECSAQTPAAELCNGLDDDCNGVTDDCSDGDIKTTDVCVQGACVSTPVDCSSLDDACHVGVVDGLTGQCVAEARDNGTLCDDDDACTPYSECDAGECVGIGDECGEERLSVGATATRAPSLLALGDGYAAQWVGSGAAASWMRVTDGLGSRRGEEVKVPAQGAGYAIRTPLTALPLGGFVALSLGTFPGTASTCYPGACPYNGWALADIPLHVTTYDAEGAFVAQQAVGAVRSACHTGAGSATCYNPGLGGAGAAFLAFGDGTFGVVRAYSDYALRPLELIPLSTGLTPGAPVQLTTDLAAADAFAVAPLADGAGFRVAWIGAGGTVIHLQAFAQSGTPLGDATTVATAADGDTVADLQLITWANDRVVVGWTAVLAGGPRAYARRYDAALAPLADAFALSEGSSTAEHLGGLAPFSDYGFVAVWDATGVDSAGLDVVTRRYAASGQPLDVEHTANLEVAGDQLRPSVVALDADEWVVAWLDAGVLMTRRFDHDGQPVAGAVERRAHAEIVGDQSAPAVAVAPDGAGAVAFQAPVYPGKSNEIRLSLLGPDGEWRARGLAVNTTTADTQTQAAVGAGDDRVVVAWTSEGQDGSLDGVFARAFDLSGAPLGGELPVNASTSGSQAQPAIAVGPSGAFVVVWTGEAAGGSDVFARGFTSGGQPAGGDVAVAGYQSQSQEHPSVAWVPGSDEVVVAWQSGGSDGDGDGIAVRRLDAAGAPLSDEFQANTTTAGNQREPSVAVSPTGRIAVCWTEGGTDTNVRCQLLKPDFSALGGEFVPHPPSTEAQAHPQTAWLPGGDLLVAWETGGVDSGGKAVSVARFDPQGKPLSSRLVANRHWAGDQRHPALAARPDDTLLVGWESDGQDTAGLGVYVRTLPAP